MRNQAMVVGLHEQWFIETEGGVQGGPYSAAQLARLLEQGTVAWTSKVWRDGLKDWRPARRDDVLVMAVASARGMSADTRRIDALGSWAQGADTICEPAHEDVGDTTQHAQPPPFSMSESEESILIHPIMRDVVRLEEAPDTAPRVAPAPEPVRQRWPTRLTTPLVAAAAFAAGALLTSLSESSDPVSPPATTAVLVAAHTAIAPAAPTVGEARVDVAARMSRDEAASTPSDVEVVTRSLPAMGEVRDEIERVVGAVRRCARRADHVDVEVAFEGASGHVSEAIVRTSSLRKERATCVAKVLHALAVAPFQSGEFRVHHRYLF